MELIKDAYGLNIVPVHYKGSGELKAAILGGVIDIASGNLSVLSSLVSSREVIGLVVMAPQRSEKTPNVPTIGEKGFPNTSFVISNGLFAPAGTPAETIDILSRALAQAMQDRSVKAQIENVGLIPEYLDGPKYKSELKRELATIRTVIEKSSSSK